MLGEEPVTAGGGYDDWDKDHDYGDTAGGPDAMTHLLMAYRQMLDHPECEPLLGPLMEIIHAKQELMTEDVMEPEPPGTRGRVLKLCESARISCLTGQAEGVITP